LRVVEGFLAGVRRFGLASAFGSSAFGSSAFFSAFG
jgi:hypothetical protein